MGCSRSRGEEDRENEAAEREEDRLRKLQGGGANVVVLTRLPGVASAGCRGVTIDCKKEGIAEVLVQFDNGDVHWVAIGHLKEAKPKPSRVSARHDWDKMPLGFVYDEDLAAFLVCPVDTVSDARRARGIPPKKRKRERWQKRPGFVDEVGLNKKIDEQKKEIEGLRLRKAKAERRFEVLLEKLKDK